MRELYNAEQKGTVPKNIEIRPRKKTRKQLFHKDEEISKEEFSKEGSIGALIFPLKFCKLAGLILEQLEDLESELRIQPSDRREGERYGVIPLDFKTIAHQFKNQPDLPTLKVDWYNLPIKRRILGDKIDDSETDKQFYIKSPGRVPKLYAEENRYGSFNIECFITLAGNKHYPPDNNGNPQSNNNSDETCCCCFPCTGKESKQLTGSGNNEDVPNIDDIKIIEMIVRNRGHWDNFYEYLSPDILTKAFEIYLTAYWFDVIPTCITVLQSINKLMINNTKPGNWVKIKEDCEKIVIYFLNQNLQID